MGKLRDQMREDLQLRGYSKSTKSTYLDCVTHFAAHYMKSPAEMGEYEVRQYLLYLMNYKNLQLSTVSVNVAALKFFYTHTLKKPDVIACIPYPKVPTKHTDILSKEEVSKLLSSIHSFKYRSVVTTIYGCGLRVQEACQLYVKDIDSDRMLIHVRQGKGAKDRSVPLTPTLLEHLRDHFRIYRPPKDSYLFQGRTQGSHVRPDTIQEVVRKVAIECGILKKVTPHILRHTYATHLLEAGLDIRIIQQLLGHRSIRTTAQYTQVSNRHIMEILGKLDMLATTKTENKEE